MATVAELNSFVDNLIIIGRTWNKYDKSVGELIVSEFYEKICESENRLKYMYSDLYKYIYSPVEKFFKFDYNKIPDGVKETFKKKFSYYLKPETVTFIKEVDFSKRFSDPLVFLLENTKHIVPKIIVGNENNQDLYRYAKLLSMAVSYTEILFDAFIRLSSFNLLSLNVEDMVIQNVNYVDKFSTWYNALFKDIIQRGIYVNNINVFKNDLIYDVKNFKFILKYVEDANRILKDINSIIKKYDLNSVLLVQTIKKLEVNLNA